MSKVKNSIELEPGWEIETDSGYKPLTHIIQTEEYEKWVVRTETSVLECADTHILFDADLNEVFVKDLVPGDRIRTRRGTETVVSVENTEEPTPMYDVCVDSPEHRYYSGDFLSHNSTITVSFLLWYILFHADKNCAILANKGATARQILARLQLAYYNLPKWLQQGIVEGGWNKGSISLENGSRIIATSTSSDSVRGESFSCVSGDTKVTIQDEQDRVFVTDISDVGAFSGELRVLTTNGFQSFDGVKVTHGKETLYEIWTEKHCLRCTPDHLLMVKDGSFVVAEHISVGDVLFPKEVVLEKRVLSNTEPVYDLLNVSGGNHYITNGLVSHNCVFVDECIGGDSVLEIKPFCGTHAEQITIEELYQKFQKEGITTESLFRSPMRVRTSNGFRRFYGIKKTAKESSLLLVFGDGTRMVCSHDHKFYEKGTFIYAHSLKPGDVLSGKTLKEIRENGRTDLYDLLEVEDGHHYTASGIEVSNCAFVPRNIWNDFWRSTYPTISSGKETKCIIVSTPNGQNHFYDIWQDAEDGKSSFAPIRVDWWDVPGRDAEWERVTRSNMSEEDFAVEYGNSFLGSSYTLIRGDYITRMGRDIKEPVESSSTLRVYKTPEKGHQYFITVDCADLGVDSSVVSVFDISRFPYEQVAVYRDSKISHLSLPTIIQRIGERYYNAPVLVESNDVGKAVLNTLNYTLEYPEVVSTKNGSRYELGVRTTKKTKALGCKALKDIIESGNLIINDRWTYEEFKRFVVSGTSYAAEEGFHDDIVMSLVLFAYFVTTPTFKTRYDQSFSDEYRESLRQELEETVLLPLPMFSDGRDEKEGMVPHSFF